MKDRFKDMKFASDKSAPPEIQAGDNAAPDGEDGTANNDNQGAGGAEPEKSARPEWYTRRIGQLTAKRREAEERHAAALAENEELKKALAHARGDETASDHGAAAGHDGTASAHSAADEGFTSATQKLAEMIRADHGDDGLAGATKSLMENSGLDFENVDHRALIGELAGMEHGGKLYHALSKDPESALAIFEAPGRKQFALLSDFAKKHSAEAAVEPPGAPPSSASGAGEKPAAQDTAGKISKAPPPVDAVPRSRGAAGGRSIYDPDLSAAEYAAMRAKKNG